ncbi:MAG TPA: hypothetical protein VFR18_23745 [Terriglobia bacterium]|nr:hypothetical protein [Terriglobia bacterium]
MRVFVLIALFLSGCSTESAPPPVNVRLVGGTELLQALVKTYSDAIPGITFSSTVQRPGAIGAVDAVETGMGEMALTGAGAAVR